MPLYQIQCRLQPEAQAQAQALAGQAVLAAVAAAFAPALVFATASLRTATYQFPLPQPQKHEGKRHTGPKTIAESKPKKPGTNSGRLALLSLTSPNTRWAEKSHESMMHGMPIVNTDTFASAEGVRVSSICRTRRMILARRAMVASVASVCQYHTTTTPEIYLRNIARGRAGAGATHSGHWHSRNRPSLCPCHDQTRPPHHTRPRRRYLPALVVSASMQGAVVDWARYR